ncbi:glycosyltransferase [Pusillimonas caeni]|uniref:glycosyltransferase family 4 protein n=1 Tax=Pusillimonas caeni TaxID=1348472 RepID=UPI000E59EE17|nr:glycosyltransferase family 4 protein [Pusillimonas caeni]TFL14850.1 glycosyltransferase [Pusillimonas caeni]
MQIKVIVLNSVLHDARVIKEANSLVKAGHDVTIIGLFDKRSTTTDHILPSGVRIHLCRPLLDEATRTVTRHARWSVFAFIMLAAIWLLTKLSDFDALVLLNALIGKNTAPVIAILLASILSALMIYRWRQRSDFLGSLCRRLIRTFVAPIRKLHKSFRNALRRFARPLYRRIRQQHLVRASLCGGVDVIHCHDIWSLPSGAEVKRKTGVPLVWDAHEIYEEVAQGDHKHTRICRKLMRRHQRDIDYFITINDSIADFYKERYPALPAATIIKNATPYIPNVAYDDRLHGAAGLPLTQKIALYQGGFAEKRGLRTLVRASKYLDPAWTLVMMGWGQLEDELKQLASDASINGTRNTPSVVFLKAAPQSELVYWTAGASVGLIPYENVGLNHLYCTPNKLWEYPAANVPILCSPLVEMAKTIQEFHTGWLLPETTEPRLIAKAINELTPSVLDQAKNSCSKFIQQDNWAIYGERLVNLYTRIALSMPPTSSTKKPDLLHHEMQD